MTDTVDESYFQELAEKNPSDICRVALCDYDHSNHTYLLSVWGEDYLIDLRNSTIFRKDADNPNVNILLGLFIMYTLLRVKEIAVSGDWISEKEVPGGAAFFRGPHKIPTHLIEEPYGNHPEEFEKRCRQLDGNPLQMADTAYAFSITPHIPVAVLLWKGDNEFPPEAKLLFDKTISEHLPPDVIFSLSVEICRRIGEGASMERE